MKKKKKKLHGFSESNKILKKQLAQNEAKFVNQNSYIETLKQEKIDMSNELDNLRLDNEKLDELL